MASDIETDIVNLIQTGGFGTVGTDIFIFEDMPSDPDQMIWVRGTGSGDPDFPSPHFNLSYPTFQVYVRDKIGYRKDCVAKIKLIKDYLRNVTSYDTGLETKIIGIRMVSPITNAGIDPKIRPVFMTELQGFYTYV